MMKNGVVILIVFISVIAGSFADEPPALEGGPSINDLEEGGAYANWFDVDIEEYSPEQMDYHLELLAEAGLITVRTSQRELSRWMPVRLTWEGHELLDAAREERRWQNAKESVARIGSVPFEIFATMLLEMAGQEADQDLLPM